MLCVRASYRLLCVGYRLSGFRLSCRVVVIVGWLSSVFGCRAVGFSLSCVFIVRCCWRLVVRYRLSLQIVGVAKIFCCRCPALCAVHVHKAGNSASNRCANKNWNFADLAKNDQSQQVFLGKCINTQRRWNNYIFCVWWWFHLQFSSN